MPEQILQPHKPKVVVVVVVVVVIFSMPSGSLQPTKQFS